MNRLPNMRSFVRTHKLETNFFVANERIIVVNLIKFSLFEHQYAFIKTITYTHVYTFYCNKYKDI